VDYKTLCGIYRYEKRLKKPVDVTTPTFFSNKTNVQKIVTFVD